MCNKPARHDSYRGVSIMFNHAGVSSTSIPVRSRDFFYPVNKYRKVALQVALRFGGSLIWRTLSDLNAGGVTPK